MITERILNSLGFENTGTNLWIWGSYTNIDTWTKEIKYPPIIIWNDNTQEACVKPLNFEKVITTEKGMKKFIDTVSFLMSKES